MSARTKPRYAQVACDLDSNPRVRKAGRNGREVFLFALRRNASPSNETPGRLPSEMLEAWYLADQLMMTEAEAQTGLDRCVAAGLISADQSGWIICGWEEHWGHRPDDSTERTRKWRKAKRSDPEGDGSDGGDDSCDVTETAVTEVTVNREEIREEKKRVEDLRPPIPQGGSFAVSNSPVEAAEPDTPELAALKSTTDREAPKANRRRTRKPVELTDEERDSARVVLEKLGARNGVKYTGSPQHLRLIANQLRAGVSEMELRAVIGYCAIELEWADKPEMAKYLRPETLFGPQTIARYLDPARTWFASLPDDAAPSAITRIRASPATVPREPEPEFSWGFDEEAAS